MQHKLTTPVTPDMLTPLTAGDTVLLSGTVYTARDAAHQRMMELLDAGIIRSIGAACSLPWLESACWYYGLPAVILMFVYIFWVLLRSAIVRRKTRR